MVKINHPERAEQMEFSKKQIDSFVFNVARRNNLTDLINSQIRKDRDQRRIYECEVCYRTFTYQNSLVAHRRKTHSFLFGRYQSE